jgi:hypothetical protein
VTMVLVEKAIEYARRGWSIIPVCGKRAVGRWKRFQSMPADEGTLRRVFGKENITGLAVVLGKASGGLAVRDFDEVDSYLAWAEASPDEAASLPTVRTHRGFHVYGLHDEEVYEDFGDGELRGDSGHYVVLPPSQHPDGSTYEWVVPLPSGELLKLPPSLFRRGLTTDLTHQTTQPTQHIQHIQHIACVTTSPEVEEAIASTLPTGVGQRNQCVFRLARMLKGMKIKKSELKEIVVEWHRRALPIIGTKEFDETWQDFQIAWNNVKCAVGASLEAALDAARFTPQPPIDGDADLGVLAALCERLASIREDRTFFLSCGTIAKHFGCDRMKAWRWLQRLQFNDIIELTKAGSYQDNSASEWQYLGPAT